MSKKSGAAAIAATSVDETLVEALVGAVRSTVGKYQQFRKGELTATTLTDLISDLVHAAEATVRERNAGALKHTAVRTAFDRIDAEYHLIEKIDAAIRLPWYAEPFDQLAIKISIDLLISGVVTCANKYGWGAPAGTQG